MPTREARESMEIMGLHLLSGQRGWVLHKATEGPDPAVSAYRKFHYRCGAQALIYVKHALDMRRRVIETDTPLDTRRMWEAGFCVSFSEGPQASRMDRRLEPVRSWALIADQALSVPLKIEKAYSHEAAVAASKTIDRLKCWWTIATVFDLDPMRHNDTLREQLIALQAPKLL